MHESRYLYQDRLRLARDNGVETTRHGRIGSVSCADRHDTNGGDT